MLGLLLLSLVVLHMTRLVVSLQVILAVGEFFTLILSFVFSVRLGWVSSKHSFFDPLALSSDLSKPLFSFFVIVFCGLYLCDLFVGLAIRYAPQRPQTMAPGPQPFIKFFIEVLCPIAAVFVLSQLFNIELFFFNFDSFFVYPHLWDRSIWYILVAFNVVFFSLMVVHVRLVFFTHVFVGVLAVGGFTVYDLNVKFGLSKLYSALLSYSFSYDIFLYCRARSLSFETYISRNNLLGVLVILTDLPHRFLVSTCGHNNYSATAPNPINAYSFYSAFCYDFLHHGGRGCVVLGPKQFGCLFADRRLFDDTIFDENPLSYFNTYLKTISTNSSAFANLRFIASTTHQTNYLFLLNIITLFLFVFFIVLLAFFFLYICTQLSFFF